MGGALALDAAWLLAALLLVLILVAVGIAARRFLLERGGGTVECGLRKGSGPWRLGLASYQLEDLYWFGVFRMSMRPEETFPRRDLSVVSRRLPSNAEAASLGPGMIVVECQLGEGSPEGRDLPGPGSGPDGSGSGSGRGSGSGGAEAMVELALAESALTGLLAWLEAAPPGLRAFAAWFPEHVVVALVRRPEVPARAGRWHGRVRPAQGERSLAPRAGVLPA